MNMKRILRLSLVNLLAVVICACSQKSDDVVFPNAAEQALKKANHKFEVPTEESENLTPLAKIPLGLYAVSEIRVTHRVIDEENVAIWTAVHSFQSFGTSHTDDPFAIRSDWESTVSAKVEEQIPFQLAVTEERGLSYRKTTYHSITTDRTKAYSWRVSATETSGVNVATLMNSSNEIAPADSVSFGSKVISKASAATNETVAVRIDPKDPGAFTLVHYFTNSTDNTETYTEVRYALQTSHL
jgi:hypothetical protein